jgi:hypothetical protein
MLDKYMTNLRVPSLCGHDRSVQRLVASTRPVPFSQTGSVARIEVVGIPVLRCQICGEERYDLDVLIRIESALHRRVMQGDRQTSYTFEQLAATEGQQ